MALESVILTKFSRWAQSHTKSFIEICVIFRLGKGTHRDACVSGVVGNIVNRTNGLTVFRQHTQIRHIISIISFLTLARQCHAFSDECIAEQTGPTIIHTHIVTISSKLTIWTFLLADTLFPYSLIVLDTVGSSSAE